MTRVQNTPSFFNTGQDIDTRLANLERAIQTLGPQDQGAAFASVRASGPILLGVTPIPGVPVLGGPSIQKAAIPTDYDGTTPAVPNGITPIIASTETNLDIVYTPTRNAWWFVFAQVSINLPGSGRFGVVLTLTPADTDEEFSAGSVITGSGWATITISKMFSIVGSQVGDSSPATTYTTSANLANLDNVGGATYLRNAAWTYMWASALPHPI